MDAARKSSEDMLVKSAEFVGWALGGFEREIAQTRERLAALNAQAVKLRARSARRRAVAGGERRRGRARPAASSAAARCRPEAREADLRAR